MTVLGRATALRSSFPTHSPSLAFPKQRQTTPEFLSWAKKKIEGLTTRNSSSRGNFTPQITAKTAFDVAQPHVMTSPLLIVVTLLLGVCLGLLGRRLLQFTSSSKWKEPAPVKPQISPNTEEKSVDRAPSSPFRKEGLLRKRARSHMLAHHIGWQKRYFVADGPELMYYKDERKHSQAHIVEYQSVSSTLNVITLTLQTGSMHLLADSEQEAADWVAHLTRREKTRDVNEIPPPSVSGVIVPAPEELEIIKAGVVEFRLIAKQEIEEWAGKGSELAIAVRDYDRAVERFLWARDLNVANALAMWRETVRYRDTQKLDTLLDKPSPEAAKIKAVFPGRYHGYDKLGRLLYIEDTGSLDLPALMAVTDIDGMMTYHLSTMEFMVKYGFPMSCARAKDPSIDTITTILNLKGLSIRLLTPLVLRFLKMVMDVDQNYYPECLGKTFIVNVPGLFSRVWKIVKPWLAPRVIAKIEIVGKVGEGSQELLSLIDASQLPTYLGGTCACEMCVDCPNAPGALVRDFLRLTEIGREQFDKENPRPTKKIGFGG